MAQKIVPLELVLLHDDCGNAPFLLERKAQLAIENGTWFRACGELVFDYCGKDYYSHPLVIGALWLHKICTGEYVHL